MVTKRLVVFVLALVMVGLAGYGYLDYQRSQPCYGFTREDMPAPVARYLCQYEQLQAMYLFGVAALYDQGDYVGLAIQDDNGRIVYFEDAEGKVLLDRRAPEPTEESKDV